MNIASMFLRILAILGAAAAAYMFWDIGNTKDQLEADLQSTQNNLTTTQGNLRTVEGERDGLTTEVATLNEDLEEATANANRLDSQLTQVRRELQQATQAINARDQEAESLRADAAQIRRQLLEERTRVGELQDSLENEDAEALRASIRNLEQQLIRTEQELQIVGSPNAVAATNQPQEIARKIIRGEVIEVAPDSPYILLNIGAEEGVRSESSVMIRREARYIGRAVISEVNDGASIAELQTGAEAVQPGDFAVTLD